MERNFFRRVEVAFPVQHARLRARIRADLDTYLADTANAWLLQADGSYVHAAAGGRRVRRRPGSCCSNA